MSHSSIFQRINKDNYEQIIFCNDREVGLKAIIAIHSTALGPALGGCRMYPYSSEDEALEDVLRLSKGMTYKASITGLKLGGGKSVIIGDPKKDKNPKMLQRFGEYVERLSGQYITAKDVGISSEDLAIIQSKTKHCLGIEGQKNSSGDPSPATAFGTYHGMRACAAHAFGSPSLRGKRIAVQGLGYVSYSLVKHLVAEGAEVIGADVDAARVELFKKEFSIKTVSPDEILFQEVDIVSPNAMGGAINSNVISKLKCKVVAGAANNQLATDQDGYLLNDRGIIYAPDYAINAGGLTNIYFEIGEKYEKEKAFDFISGIYKTIDEILIRSKKEKVPPHRIADTIAEERVRAAEKGKRN